MMLLLSWQHDTIEPVPNVWWTQKHLHKFYHWKLMGFSFQTLKTDLPLWRYNNNNMLLLLLLLLLLKWISTAATPVYTIFWYFKTTVLEISCITGTQGYSKRVLLIRGTVLYFGTSRAQYSVQRGVTWFAPSRRGTATVCTSYRLLEVPGYTPTGFNSTVYMFYR